MRRAANPLGEGPRGVSSARAGPSERSQPPGHWARRGGPDAESPPGPGVCPAACSAPRRRCFPPCPSATASGGSSERGRFSSHLPRTLNRFLEQGCLVTAPRSQFAELLSQNQSRLRGRESPGKSVEAPKCQLGRSTSARHFQELLPQV